MNNFNGSTNAKNRFNIQDEQYKFPYHHLVRFDVFNNFAVMPWGFEYYAYMSKVIGIIANSNPKSLLDIGCGEGKMIFELAKIIPGKTMHGIDLSESAIFFAKAFNYGNGSSFECKDIAAVAATYDVITLIEVMEHIPDEKISATVGHISKRLHKNGRVIVTVPSVNFPVISKHYRHYDLKLIREQFNGFELENFFYVVRQGFLYTILIRVSRKFCSFNFARNFFFSLARKFIFEATDTTGRHIICVFKKYE